MEKTYTSVSSLERNQDLQKIGKKWQIYRWTIALIIVPFFYLASSHTLGLSGFLKLLGGILVYNALVSYYLAVEYPKSKQIPGYVYYIDAMMVSVMSWFFGGIHSDVYLIFVFVIASFGVRYSVGKTLRFSLVIISMYSISVLVKGMLTEPLWVFTRDFLELFMRNLSIFLVAHAVGLMIKEVRKVDNLHRQEFMRARTDKLTGLPNRHHMEQLIEGELQDCIRNNKVLNVLMFDIDNFKHFNDTYGHQWGDELLKRFSDILRQSIRKADMPIRYGGEEFMVLIKDIDYVTAKSVGDRVRRQLEKQKIDIEREGTKSRVTVSCGISQFPTQSTDFKEIVKMADKALYYAKLHGKNVVVGYDFLQTMENQGDIEEERSQSLDVERFLTS